ncbi:hypothetical protein [Parasphingorhabdus sp.]|uniref:hypothetical protein n=1 Tax=Parasphingorhabdus sp. TaxID=2709688 RepID=UPI003C796207
MNSIVSNSALLASLLLIPGSLSQAQTANPPKAQYEMDIGTVTGFGGMTGGIGSAMSMMFGGKAKPSHMLELRLGSRLAPTGGAASADHFPDAGLRLGKSLPLITPVTSAPEPSDRMPEKFERPQGRLLLFWGCGAKAGPGQPVVIDFAKVAAGQMPPGLFSTRVPVESGLTRTNSKTYGSWPNQKSGKMPDSNASILGEHRVAGNYTPEMKFTLNQDFMGPLNAQSSPAAGGATNLNWNNVSAATGYYAWVMGGKMTGEKMGDMVWWSSSMSRDFGGGLWDWLSPATVRRLIADKTVMPPTQTSCTIPAEVKAAAPQFMMGNLTAFGPESNFAYPPRPATGVWNPEWTARARYRSTTSLLMGEGMEGIGDMSDNDQNEQPKKKPCKPSMMGALLGKTC